MSLAKLPAYDRRRLARIGALSLHAQGRTNTEVARAALQRKFEDEVDPERLLPEAERKRRAEYAKQRHYERVTRKRLKTMAANKAARAKAN